MGDIIRDIVADSGMSPIMVAKRAGLNPDTLYNIMAGADTSNIKTYRGVCAACGADAASLLRLLPPVKVTIIKPQKPGRKTNSEKSE